MNFRLVGAVFGGTGGMERQSGGAEVHSIAAAEVAHLPGLLPRYTNGGYCTVNMPH